MSDKPVYTKEMHERGELPPVGIEIEYPSGKGVVVLNKPDDHGIIIVAEEFEGDSCYKRVALSGIKPIPTIEGELFDFIYIKQKQNLYKGDCLKLVNDLVGEFNITPKDS